MEDTHVLRKKLLAVLKAAVLGAVIGDGLIILVNLAYMAKSHLPKFVDDFFTGLSFMLAIPSVAFGNRFNIQGGIADAYVVNGALGAIIFAVVAAIWQFWLKLDYEK